MNYITIHISAVIAVCFLIFLFYGKPDIHDALMHCLTQPKVLSVQLDIVKE